MSLFSSAKAKLAASKLAEEQLYAQAAEEVASGQIRQGLWAKALAESDGDETAAKGRYLKLRVEIMRAEADVVDYAIKQAAKDAALDAEANKPLKEIDFAVRWLERKDYKVKIQGSRFRVFEPLGGRTEWKSEKELIEYAKERGFKS